ncbi:MAG: DUF502 domain-containing protein [Candidatus Dadabacteria bacterium]|nr:DUF502 domain-containing protein [Candidatus Dadabacteria bacterium]NIT14505.1 DUF502 domain-containing protein [Candidatus Dadabacteria bacterium]
MSKLTSSIERNFLTGLLVIIPFGLTLFVVYKISLWVVRVISFVPAKFIEPLSVIPKPLYQYVTFSIGLVGALIIIVFIGIIARHYLGGKLLGFGESIISKIPFARTIYSASKQIIETVLFSTGFKGFKRVIMLEFPRKGIFCLGFVTGNVANKARDDTDETLLSIFVPNTPNPTSGYYLMLPEKEVQEVSISVEDAFKVIISGGLAAKDFELIKKSNKDYND